uniref:P-type domain-containing protein n=1 Tax=Amazona collaria TaxID=241587 RepID=A0A8B9IXF2_9PSIT
MASSETTVSQRTECQCKMEAKERRNCGYPGITAEQCRKGCCFRSHPAGVPWCFYHRQEGVSPSSHCECKSFLT